MFPFFVCLARMFRKVKIISKNYFLNTPTTSNCYQKPLTMHMIRINLLPEVHAQLQERKKNQNNCKLIITYSSFKILKHIFFKSKSYCDHMENKFQVFDDKQQNIILNL